MILHQILKERIFQYITYLHFCCLMLILHSEASHFLFPSIKQNISLSCSNLLRASFLSQIKYIILSPYLASKALPALAPATLPSEPITLSLPPLSPLPLSIQLLLTKFISVSESRNVLFPLPGILMSSERDPS